MTADASSQEEISNEEAPAAEQNIVMDEVFFYDSDTYESISLVQGQDEAHMLFAVRAVEGETLIFNAPEYEYIWGLNYVYLADLNSDGADEIVIECAQTAYYFGAYIIDVANQCFLEVPHESPDSYVVGINYDVLPVDENSFEITNEDTGYDEIVDIGYTEFFEMNVSTIIGGSADMSHIYIVEYDGRECLAIWQNLVLYELGNNSTMGSMETVLSYDSQGNYHIEKQRYVKDSVK